MGQLVEFDLWPAQVQDCREIPDRSSLRNLQNITQINKGKNKKNKKINM